MEELGRELVELVREGTNLSYAESKATASAVVSHVYSALNLAQLGPLAAALDQDLVDVNSCGDADRLRDVLAWVASSRQDSQERSWALHESLSATLENLALLADLFAKADPRVPLHILALEDYQPLYNLIDLYQMETREAVRRGVRLCINRCLGLGPATVAVASSSILPLELARELCERRTKPEPGQQIALLARCFSTAVPLPYTHYEVLNEDLVRVLLELGEESDDDISSEAHKAVIAFSLHFTEEQNLVIDALQRVGKGRQRFSENLVDFLNNFKHDPVWQFSDSKPPYVSSILCFLRQIFRVSGLGDDIFYVNDAVVLVDVLIRQILDSEPNEKRTLELRVLNDLMKGSYIGKERSKDLANLDSSLKRQEDLSHQDSLILQELHQHF